MSRGNKEQEPGISHPVRGYPLRAKFGLILPEGHTGRITTKVFRGISHKGTPTTANIQEAREHCELRREGYSSELTGPWVSDRACCTRWQACCPEGSPEIQKCPGNTRRQTYISCVGQGTCTLLGLH